mmetsp:Transcript_35610/g.83267  ORF Transcript_35610/g.83267 Transcript_35610/m.83267 type:complete len:204 (+) Transcript_35610:593-1204(+)
MVRSSDPDTNTSAPSRMVKALTSLVWPVSVFTEENVSKLQTLMVLSCDPEQRTFLDRAAAMHFTKPRWPGKVPMYWRLFKSQIMMLLSWEPVNKTSPTVQSESTKPACPAKMCIQCSSGADIFPPLGEVDPDDTMPSIIMGFAGRTEEEPVPDTPSDKSLTARLLLATFACGGTCKLPPDGVADPVPPLQPQGVALRPRKACC